MKCALTSNKLAQCSFPHHGDSSLHNDSTVMIRTLTTLYLNLMFKSANLHFIPPQIVQESEQSYHDIFPTLVSQPQLRQMRYIRVRRASDETVELVHPNWENGLVGMLSSSIRDCFRFALPHCHSLPPESRQSGPDDLADLNDLEHLSCDLVRVSDSSPPTALLSVA
ncbi:hypothetical protein CC79DRAFT_921719 [Sarocladium strictum]